MNQMKIRPLMKDDASFLRVALFHAIHVPPGAEPPPLNIVNHPELARYAQKWMQQSGDIGLLSEIQGKPIGAAWLRLWSGKELGFGFIDNETPELSMSVLPGYRGRGIGTLLLNRLLQDAESQFNAISLSVSSSNPALRLYERAGFTSVGGPVNGSITMLKNFFKIQTTSINNAFQADWKQ